MDIHTMMHRQKRTLENCIGSDAALAVGKAMEAEYSRLMSDGLGGKELRDALVREMNDLAMWAKDSAALLAQSEACGGGDRHCESCDDCHAEGGCREGQ